MAAKPEERDALLGLVETREGGRASIAYTDTGQQRSSKAATASAGRAAAPAPRQPRETGQGTLENQSYDYESKVRVGAEPATYTRTGLNSYLRDLAASQISGDEEARQRLTRHGYEVTVAAEYQEYRDLTRVDGAGGYMVPPKYLVDQTIELARAAADGEPVQQPAACCRVRHDVDSRGV